MEGKNELTPWEQLLEKKKEKTKKEAEALAAEDPGDEFPSDVGLNDPDLAEEAKKLGIKKKSTKPTKDSTSSEEEAGLEKQKAEMTLPVMDEGKDDKKHLNSHKIVAHQSTRV